MSPVDNLRLCPQFLFNSPLDGRKMRARVPDRVAVLHAGGKHDCFCTPVNHHPGPGDSFLAGAATAREKADDLHRTGLFEGQCPFPGDLEIGAAGAHILSQLTTYDSYLHLCLPLLVIVVLGCLTGSKELIR